MDFWFPIHQIPQSDIDDTIKNLQIKGNHCILINIVDHCDICNVKYTIATIGSNLKSSLFGFGYCKHNYSYKDIWNNRLKNNSVSSTFTYNVIKSKVKTINPAEDGCRCIGSCGSWVPFAEPNRDDGTFMCYGCRTEF